MKFAELYDLFQQDVDYENLMKPIIPYLSKKQTLLDAGCGSGYILSYLLNDGFDVIGLDNDESMLEYAQKKLSYLDGKERIFFHDLRKPLHHKFHQIISLLDVFHYFKGIKGVSKNLYNALYDGGKLIIDLYKRQEDSEEVDMLYDMAYHWKVKTIGHRLMHHIHIKNDHQEHTFHVKQYYYDLSYYMDILQDVGFKIETFEGFDDRKIYLVCTK